VYSHLNRTRCNIVCKFFPSGSYDENLRLWDERNLKFEVESFCVGGGIWRIKQQLERDTLLVAAMHGGFLVLDKEDKDQIHKMVAARYEEHQSIAYGADWLQSGLVATCSFYDHMMRIWSY
jgi:diphthine methyl ester acylhydrolase